MSKTQLIPVIFFSLFLFGSCKLGSLLNEQLEIPDSGWKVDNTMDFNFEISDTSSLYNIDFMVKHTEYYYHSNLWLFTHIWAPSGALLIDTINLQMADHRGKWYGKNWFGSYALLHPYKHGVKFVIPGTHTITVTQGMRYHELKELKSVGLKVTKL